MMKNKNAGLLNQVLVQIILVGIIFALFFIATADKINARGVRQQVLEKEIALLIDSAVPGMEFSISKNNVHGVIQSIELKEGRVFVKVDGLVSFKGYPYFSKHDVEVREEEDRFVVFIK